MSLFVKGLSNVEAGEYKVIVFVDPVDGEKKILIDREQYDNKGRKIGDYPMYPVQEIKNTKGDLIDSQASDIRLKNQACGMYEAEE